MPLIEFEDDVQNQAKIKVIGVGGGGGNAINTMIASGLGGVDFVAANTDLQALDSNLAPMKVQVGAKLTKGLGAGANPSVGREAALEDSGRLQEVLDGADMVFVTAGMGGGTGTGGAPIIAKVARELGILTVGVVTKPFIFEGRKRMRQAEEGIKELQDSVDTLITIPNQRLLSVAGQATTMLDAFRKVDEVLLNAVQGISDLIIIHGFINVDFADVRTVMSDMGRALMGTGYAAGDRKALEAAQQAISSPLLEDATIDGATGILINITGGPDLTLTEINEAATLIQEAAHEDANIIFGSVVDANMEDQVRITVIATGFDRGTVMDQTAAVASASAPHQVPAVVQQSAPAVSTPAVSTPTVSTAAVSTPAVSKPTEEVAYAMVAEPPRQAPAPTVATATTAPAPPTPVTPAAPMARTPTGPHQVVGAQTWPQTGGWEPPQATEGTAQANQEINVAKPASDPRVTEQTMRAAEQSTPGTMVGAGTNSGATHSREASTPADSKTATTSASTPQQQALPYQEPVEANDGTAPRRPRRAPSQSVPRLHPGLGVADEKDMDVPAFLRRQATPNND